jgi:hypothetical protein
MPLDGTILGFKNSWYRPAMETAQEHELKPGLKLLMVNSVYFCASKLEAFGDRGRNDYLGSHDLEDVIAVVDGRAELVEEIQLAQSDVRSYLAKEITKLCAEREFVDALPGHLAPDSASQERITIVMARLKGIASLCLESAIANRRRPRHKFHRAIT